MNDLYESRAEILRTLGESTRLKIIEFLRNGERSASDIYPAICEDEDDTAHHLNLMLAAGILSRSRQGFNIFYAIKHDEVLTIADLAREILARESSVDLPAPKSLRGRKKSAKNGA